MTRALPPRFSTRAVISEFLCGLAAVLGGEDDQDIQDRGGGAGIQRPIGRRGVAELQHAGSGPSRRSAHYPRIRKAVFRFAPPAQPGCNNLAERDLEPCRYDVPGWNAVAWKACRTNGQGY